MKQATVEEDYSPEERRLIDWRLHRFLELGVAREEAQNLSERFDVSHHQLRKLLDAGCDLDTALRVIA